MQYLLNSVFVDFILVHNRLQWNIFVHSTLDLFSNPVMSFAFYNMEINWLLMIEMPSTVILTFRQRISLICSLMWAGSWRTLIFLLLYLCCFLFCFFTVMGRSPVQSLDWEDYIWKFEKAALICIILKYWEMFFSYSEHKVTLS